MKTRALIAIVAVAIVVIVVAVAAAILLSGSKGPSSPPPPSSSSVTIQNFAFNPGTLNINKGTTVTWTNKDNVDHTATSQSGPASFDSGNIAPGGTYSFTFNTAGTYQYICTIHPFMKGTIVVT